MVLTLAPDNATLYRYIREVNATYGSETVACLERVYQRARELTPDLPANVSFTIKQSGRKGRSIVLGHFLRGAFDNGTLCAPEEAVHEINISGDCLSRGPLQVLQTVLHEAVHALCAVRGIKETTRQNRYHNRKFVQAAEELTLTYDDPQNYITTVNKQGEKVLKLTPDATIGFSNVCITDKTRELYKKELDMLMSDLPINKGRPVSPRSTPRTQDKVFTVFPPKTPESNEYQIRVFGPKKYEDQVEFLVPHVRVWSKLTLGVMVGLLDYVGISTDKDEDLLGTNDYIFAVDNDHVEFPQEVDTLVSLINENQFTMYEREEI
jgi:hypothetical protein